MPRLLQHACLCVACRMLWLRVQATASAPSPAHAVSRQREPAQIHLQAMPGG